MNDRIAVNTNTNTNTNTGADASVRGNVVTPPVVASWRVAGGMACHALNVQPDAVWELAQRVNPAAAASYELMSRSSNWA